MQKKDIVHQGATKYVCTYYLKITVFLPRHVKCMRRLHRKSICNISPTKHT